jgi:hypothetical protein
VGVCCSPLSHNLWDPARYGDLHHPGDAYSFDIFAQAVEALRQGAVSVDGVAGGVPMAAPLTSVLADGVQTPVAGGNPVLGGLDATNVVATGTSQSASRLHTMLDRIEGIRTANIDGYLLDAGGSRTFTRPPVRPTIHFLSEDGLSATEPNAAGASLMGTDDLYRLWEVPAASHADAEFSRYIEDGLYRAQERSRSPKHRPSAVRDANRQIVGGVRLPHIDVPVADYLATTCGLFGHTIGYDPLTLASLYPSTEDYVAQMEAAIERALASGSMLEPEAAELRVQLESAVVPSYRPPKAPGALDEGAAHLLASLVG